MTFNQCRDHGHGVFMVHNGARVELLPTSGKLRLHTMVSAAGLRMIQQDTVPQVHAQLPSAKNPRNLSS